MNLSSVRSGHPINLIVEEALGGHTIARHIAIAIQVLRQRLQTDPLIHLVSSFTDISIATSQVTAAIQANAPALGMWLASGAPARFVIDHDAGIQVGYGCDRLSAGIVSLSKLRIVATLSNAGIDPCIVLTSFPIR